MAAEGWFDPELVVADWFPVDLNAWFDSTLVAQTATTTHATTGALTGQGATATGSANRFREFSSSGTLTGSGAAVAGAAQHNVPHATTGALAGQGAAVTGSANRFRAFDSSGALAGQGAAVTGSANRFRTFGSSGTLVGGDATLTGSANRFRAFSSSGSLAGSGTTLAGAAQRFRAFASTGTLAGQGSDIVGTALVSKTHGTTGVLVGPGSAVAGAADRQAYDLTITYEMATQLYQIYMLHGLQTGSPLVVTPTTRSAGGFTQNVAEVGGTVTITTSASATVGLPPLTQLIEELAALHGIGETLSVTAASRTAGAISQTIVTTGGVTTVTRS